MGGARAGVHVSTHSGYNRSPGVHASTYPACNSIPGVGLDGATGYHVPECFIGCPLDEVVHMDSCWDLNVLDCLGVAMSVDPSYPSGLLQSYAYAGARLAPWFVGLGAIVKGGAWLIGRFGTKIIARSTAILASPIRAVTKTRLWAKTIVRSNKSLGQFVPFTFFARHTYKKLERLLIRKFGPARGGAPGGKSFYNPRTGRTFHLHQQPGHMRGKPHIDISPAFEAIIKRCEQNLAPLPTETVLFEAGGVAALLGITTRLGLVELIDEIIPKRGQGPSVGHYIVLAALNRVLDPLSKSQIGDWYHDTVLQRLWRFSPEVFNSQRYWDHMDMITDDAMDKIQNFLVERVKREFKIDPQPLLYDTTNFFTYIDTHNDRNTIAKRGRNKQKRCDLRQVNLALLTTRDFQIPLFHRAYEGNTPDVKFFPEVMRDLLGRHAAVFGHFGDSTLVFDKGNLSQETLEELLYSDIYFVAGMKAEVLPEIFTAPIDQFQEALMIPGTKFYESPVELYGKSCKAVVSYSESFFTQQLAALTATMTKCQDKLKELQNDLLFWSNSKKPKGPRPTKAKVKERLKDILSAQHMKEVFTIELEEFDGLPYLRYSVNRKELDRLTSTFLGRTLLITNRQSWLPTETITSYRELANIEDAFKHMKNRDYLRWQPAFHWTDQKIRVHTFYCVVALLLATLARKMAWEAGIELSLVALLDDLSSMKEVALLYPDDRGQLKAQFTMNKMSPRQKKLAELFKIGEFLTEG